MSGIVGMHYLFLQSGGEDKVDNCLAWVPNQWQALGNWGENRFWGYFTTIASCQKWPNTDPKTTKSYKFPA